MTARRPAAATAPRATAASGRAALVTGSARRLGRAIALRLARAGHFTFVHYLGSRREAESALRAIERAGGRGALVTGDLGDPAGVETLAEGVRAGLRAAKLRTLDVLVNNVGVYKTGPLETFAPDDFDAVLRANLSGAYRLIHALRPLIPRGGNIVNIGYAGVEPPTGTTHNTAYLISKAGLLVLTKSLALALGPRGIRVNMVSPGVLSNSVEVPKRDKDLIPLGRLGSVEEVTDAVEFIVSDRARYVSGVNLDVAGGYHLLLKSLEGDAIARAGNTRAKEGAARGGKKAKGSARS